MSQFLSALAFTLSEEGGYANVAGDTGGETYRGISRNNFSSWEGWPVIDSMRLNPEFPRCLSSNAEIQDAVVKF